MKVQVPIFRGIRCPRTTFPRSLSAQILSRRGEFAESASKRWARASEDFRALISHEPLGLNQPQSLGLFPVSSRFLDSARWVGRVGESGQPPVRVGGLSGLLQRPVRNGSEGGRRSRWEGPAADRLCGVRSLKPGVWARVWEKWCVTDGVTEPECVSLTVWEIGTVWQSDEVRGLVGTCGLLWRTL